MKLKCFCIVLLAVGTARAATVTFDLFPTSDPSAETITVVAGETVGYTITVTVTSDNPTIADSDGLAGFSVDVLTDLGVGQQPADAFDAVILAGFPLFPSLGSPKDPDDLLGISAFSEATLGGAGTLGIALEETITLASGVFLTDSSTAGTFTVMFDGNATATVLQPGGVSLFDAGAIVLGPGFSIITQAPDDSTTGTTDNTSGPTGNDTGSGSFDPFSSALAFFFTFVGPIGIVAALLIAIFLNVATGTFS